MSAYASERWEALVAISEPFPSADHVALAQAAIEIPQVGADWSDTQIVDVLQFYAKVSAGMSTPIGWRYISLVYGETDKTNRDRVAREWLTLPVSSLDAGMVEHALSALCWLAAGGRVLTVLGQQTDSVG